MRKAALATLVLLAGCAGGSDDTPADATPIIDAYTDVPGVEIGPSDSGTIDTGGPTDTGAPPVDTSVSDTGASDTGVVDTGASDTGVADTGSTTSETGVAYRHTITIDGTNDFTAANEKLSTTTSSFDAYVTWDATALYVGYSGGDVADTTATTKWLFVYFDVDPGAGTGATSSEQYATQKHAFASGFGAEHYYAWRTDGLFPQQKSWSGTAWTNATATVTASRSGSFVELEIPFSTFGSTPSKLGLTTFFVNESSAGEWTYAGLYSTSFTDGKSPTSTPKTIASYMKIDLASAAAPNATAYKAP